MTVIEIRGLSHAYQGIQALANINLTIDKGERVAVIGHNGSGKTTLLYHLNGTFLPQRGEVTVLELPVNKKTRGNIRRKVGLVFDNPDHQLFSTTVFDDVAFGPRNMGLNEEQVSVVVEQALKTVEVNDLSNRSPHRLSHGQKKRVALAGVLAMKPDILLLDEVFSGLDPATKRNMLSLLAKMSDGKKTTQIISTHDLDIALEWSEQVIILKEGNIVSRGTPELLHDMDLISDAGLEPPTLSRTFRGTGFKPRTTEEANSILKKVLNGNSLSEGDVKNVVQKTSVDFDNN